MKLLRVAAALTLIFTCLKANSQLLYQSSESAEVKRFKTNSLYLIAIGKQPFDDSLKKVMSIYWKLPNFKGLISKRELDALIKDPSNSFIYPRVWSYMINRQTSRTTSGIFCFNGGRKNTDKYHPLIDMVAQTPFDAYRYEGDIENSMYRLPLMIKGLNDLFFVKDTASKKLASSLWKKKVLLVNEKHIKGEKYEVLIKENAMAAYPYKYEITSEERIATLIANKDPNYLVMIPTLNDSGAEISVYDLQTQTEVIYYRRKSPVMGARWVRDNEIQELAQSVVR